MSKVIRLQEPRLISLGGSNPTSETQPESLGAYVGDSRLVVPFIRVIRDAANSLSGGASIAFTFYTAAALLSSDESTTSGLRFVELTGYTITISDTYSGNSTNGKTYTGTISSGKITPLENPGAILIWKASLTGTSGTLKFEIDLIGRE
jgi:hypothetical protein